MPDTAHGALLVTSWRPCDCHIAATPSILTGELALAHPPIAVQARGILKSLPSLVDIPLEDSQQITVCGDVHGQFYDLLNIFKINGLPSKDNPYLFNGRLMLTLCP